MNKKYVASGFIALGVLLIGAAVILRMKQQPQQEVKGTSIDVRDTNKIETRETDPDGGVETPESITREKAEYEKMESNTLSTPQASGSYKDYSAQTVALEQKAGHKVILFFHAPWCPYCQAADKDFKAHLDKIPTNVTVLKTDYDSNVELKKKYGVSYQHTFVQIDDKGDRLAFWVSGDTDDLVKNIK